MLQGQQTSAILELRNESFDLMLENLIHLNLLLKIHRRILGEGC
jgi:hypothetical protein